MGSDGCTCGLHAGDLLAARRKEFDARMLREFPDLRWREPITVTVPGLGQTMYGCRLCIGFQGFVARDIVKLPQSREEFDQHMKEVHGDDTSGKDAKGNRRSTPGTGAPGK